jgi:hypothetical protein
MDDTKGNGPSAGPGPAPRITIGAPPATIGAPPTSIVIGGPGAPAEMVPKPSAEPRATVAAAPSPPRAERGVVHLHAGKGIWTLEEVERLLWELGFDPRRFTPEPELQKRR